MAANAGRRANARLANLGIDTRLYGALAVIAGTDGPSQQTVAALLGTDRATVVGLVDELERRELIVRTPNPRDRRAHALRPTGAGRQLLTRADRLLDDCEQAFLSPVGTDERAALARTLEALLDQRDP